MTCHSWDSDALLCFAFCLFVFHHPASRENDDDDHWASAVRRYSEKGTKAPSFQQYVRHISSIKLLTTTSSHTALICI